MSRDNTQLLRGALVVDGTGAPGARHDVLVADGRIVGVGDLRSERTNADEEIDLDGLVLAPGFIDPHTHYDAQVLWDPDLTPSTWHGVTTVLMGNCGFGIAPTRPQDRTLIARTLENVEGMTYEALEAGIPWGFETYPEYLAAIERLPIRANVAAFVGHTAVRTYVLGGAEASERPATAEERDRIAAVIEEALAAGAFGVATSQSSGHAGADGAPVASRLADSAELDAIAAVLRAAGHGVFQSTYGGHLDAPVLARMAAASGRPVTWTALLSGYPDLFGGRDPIETVEWQASLGEEVWPQISCRPLLAQLTLREPGHFASVPAFREVFRRPRAERARVYADPAWRDRAREELGDRWDRRFAKTYVRETGVHHELVGGPSLAELAQERHCDPFDVAVDLSLAEDLDTRFDVVLGNDDDAVVGELLRDDRVLLATSDAGAHASQICDAGFTTFLLGTWVREREVLTLEHAVWRLTGHPAQILGITDRGRVAPSFAADLVAFDPNVVGSTEAERRWDLPAGADRLVTGSVGIEHMWVNGVQTRAGGRDRELDRGGPGAVLRSRRTP